LGPQSLASMAMALTPKQAAFVREYLVDLNQTKAAERAGYPSKSAATQGSRLFRNVQVRAEIDKALSRRAARVEVTADEVLRELKRIGLSDIRQAYTEGGRLKGIHEMPEDVARAIGGVETEELFEGEGRDRERAGDTVKVKFWPKVQALELLGKHLKMFTDKTEVSGEDGGPLRVSVNINRSVAK
jgi:phage terminase small subunit